MEIGKIEQLEASETIADELAQFLRTVTESPTDPQDWCCETCRFYDEAGACESDIVWGYIGLNSEFFPVPEFGCKFWRHL